MELRSQSDMVLKLFYELYLGVAVAIREGMSIEQMVEEYEKELTRRGLSEWLEETKKSIIG